MEFKYLYWIFEEDLDYLICMFVVGFFFVACLNNLCFDKNL